MIVHYLYRWSSSFLFRCNIVLSYQKPKVRNFVCMYSYIEYNWCYTTFYELLTKKNHVYAFPHYCTIYYGVPLYDYEAYRAKMRECEVAKGKVRRCEDKGVEVRRYDGKEWRSEGAQLQRQRSDTSISLICFATVHFRRRTFTLSPSHFFLYIIWCRYRTCPRFAEGAMVLLR